MTRRRLLRVGTVIVLCGCLAVAGTALGAFTEREANPQTLAAISSFPGKPPAFKVRALDPEPGSTTQIAISFEIENTGGKAADLSLVKLRYWFTNDLGLGGLENLGARCDSTPAPLTCSQMTLSVSMLDPAKDKSDRYLEIGFTGGFVPAKGTTGVMEIAIIRAGGDDTLFTEDNDYSEVSKAGLADAKKFALFYDGDPGVGEPARQQGAHAGPRGAVRQPRRSEPERQRDQAGSDRGQRRDTEHPPRPGGSPLLVQRHRRGPCRRRLPHLLRRAEIGCGNVTRNVVDVVPPPRPQADKYLEVGFSGGTLYVGSSTGETNLRIQADDNAPLNETNDYSRATNTDYAEWDKVTAYVGPTLVWGDKP